MNNIENNNSPYIEDTEDYGKTLVSKPVPEKNIGIDQQDTLFQNIIEAGVSSQLDISLEILDFGKNIENVEYDVNEEDTVSAVSPSPLIRHSYVRPFSVSTPLKYPSLLIGNVFHTSFFP